jgi:class 3 adenylate cyclase
MSSAPDPSGHRLALGDASELVAGVLRAAAERRSVGGSSLNRGEPAGPGRAARLAHWAFSGRAGWVLGEVFQPFRAWVDSALPQGEVTFVLGDIEGSTRLWEQHPEMTARAMERMELCVAREVERSGGFLPRDQGEGDSFFAVFADPGDAVKAALLIQEAVAAAGPEGLGLPLRLAVHTGPAQLRHGNYFGVEVNRCARIRSLADGGRVLISSRTFDAVKDGLPDEVSVRPLGRRQLRDLSRPEELFQLTLEPAGDSANQVSRCNLA